MGPLGFPELIIIFFVALIIFGPRKLPELGRSLGKSLSEFKRASTELRSTLDDEIRSEERRTSTPAPGVAGTVVSDPVPHAPTVPSESYDANADPETVARGESRI